MAHRNKDRMSSKRNYNLHIRNRHYRYLPFHPYHVVLILVLAGISCLFLGVLAAYIYTALEQGLEPPKPPFVFALSTFVLIVSSLSINKAYRAYQEDRTYEFRFYLWGTLGCTLIFLILQALGWYHLFASDITLQSGNGAGYLYMLSGLHFLHVIAGIPFLAWFIHLSYAKMRDPVAVLIYFADPAKKLRLKLIRRYWHFLDVLWIVLVVILTSNYLIKNYLDLLN